MVAVVMATGARSIARSGPGANTNLPPARRLFDFSAEIQKEDFGGLQLKRCCKRSPPDLSFPTVRVRFALKPNRNDTPLEIED